MDEVQNTQEQVRPVCRWCCRYASGGHGDGFCSGACASMFSRYGVSVLELQLKNDIFEVSRGRFRKSCRWCFGFYWTDDPRSRFCLPAHEEEYCAHGRRSMAQVRLDEYEPERFERRRTRDFVKVSCRFCGARFLGRQGSKFCCERHQKLYSRHKCTQKEFYKRFNIVGEEDGKYLKQCQCCGKEFLTVNVTQENCSTNCNKVFAKHGRLSYALFAKKRAVLKAAVADGVANPFGVSARNAVISADDSDWKAKVEWVMALPADQRFAFTRDWTDRERSYAQGLTHQVGVSSGDGGLAALSQGVEDLDALW